jgi:hypothetical protein
VGAAAHGASFGAADGGTAGIARVKPSPQGRGGGFDGQTGEEARRPMGQGFGRGGEELTQEVRRVGYPFVAFLYPFFADTRSHKERQRDTASVKECPAFTMTNQGGALVEAWPQTGRSNVEHQNE